LSSQNNPFIIVNSFFENFPDPALAKHNINVNLINLILGNHISNFNLSFEEFEELNNVKPVKIQFTC